MSGAVQIIIMIVAVAIGYFICDYYSIKYYNEIAVQTGPLLLQCIFLFLITLIWPKINLWFILCGICLALSYLLAISECAKRADEIKVEKKDKTLAIIAQCVLPVGLVLVFIVVLIIIFGSGNNTKRKSRRK